MSPLDVWTRRLGPVMLVLGAPFLAIPVVMVVMTDGRMSTLDWIVVIGGGAGSVGIYVAALVFVVRTYRRDYSELFEDEVDGLGREHEPDRS